jgi:FAD/FMN-containing dehydrogenase
LASAPDESCVRGRLACLPSALGVACATLKKSGAHLIAQPGLGLVQAEFSVTGTKASLDTQEMVALLERISREAKGTLMLEALPPDARDDHDVFAEEIAAFPIMKELKRQFDPHGVLNPGRFVGNL